VLKEEEISIDHFIPWSYIYSDDLWNLVITSKSYNSTKTNKRPSNEYLEKLKEQNLQLIDILKDEGLLALIRFILI
jgi:CRISPR/Cas system Type II protein with McrA/HNH and RuvC-like nuclease domain